MYACFVVIFVARAIAKRTIADAGDAVWDGDRGKRGATDKRLIADAGDAVWDGDGGKRGATFKRTIADAGDVLPQVYRFSVRTRHSMRLGCNYSAVSLCHQFGGTNITAMKPPALTFMPRNSWH